MSWILGYFGNRDRLQLSSPETPLHTFQDPNLILFVGGNTETIFYKADFLKAGCWAVAGIGLQNSGDEFFILNNTDWNSYLIPEKINLGSVNGHFVAVKYANDELKFFTDELGLREIYIVELSEGFGFSTRIDWLKYFINPELDLNEFGSRWLLQNQISRGSIVKNVKRLVCTNATIRNNTLSIEQNLWQPDFEIPGSREIFDATLKKLLSVDGRKISLSLSGGLDSRFLLSYLAIKNSNLWETHTFGDPNHPDSKIASELLSGLKLKHETIDDELPLKDKLIELIKSYAFQSIVTNPISSILNLRFYDRLAGQNKIIIDGGFGEIWRREFANRLLLIGRKALLNKDSKAVAGFLRYNRADIFSDEVLVEMEKGMIEQLNNLFEEMPEANQITPSKWIDLFSIRSRLTNYYAPEQARIDQYVLSFMPLVQKDMLKLLFGFNNADKKNGKLFKELIRQNSIQLTKHLLVKGSIVHPFNSSSLSARLHSRIKNLFSINYQSKQPDELFNSLKEFINDLIRSSVVRNCDLYDQRKVERIANDFSRNEMGFNFEMDWFLSFELFRQGISK